VTASAQAAAARAAEACVVLVPLRSVTWPVGTRGFGDSAPM